MKIKEICEKTGLTDRTVRFYIEEQLISPFYSENYLGRKSFDFSEEDLERLKNIATLRTFGFSVEEIKRLSSGEIEAREIVEAVKQRAEENLDESRHRLNVLSALEPSDETDLSRLAQKIANTVPTIESEGERRHMGKRVLSFLAAVAVFLAVWLPLISAIVVLVLRLSTLHMPIVRPVFLVYTLLCFLPSMVTVIVLQKIKKSRKILRIFLSAICVLCLPLGILFSSKSVVVCEHSYEPYRTTTEATCAREGECVMQCTLCKHFETQALEKLPHTPDVAKGFAPTCAKEGLSDEITCSVCLEVLEKHTPIPPTARHTPVIDVAIPATCEDEGRTEGSHCAVCLQVLVPQIILPQTNLHISTIDEGLPATCKNPGLTDGSHCAACQMILVEQRLIPATGEHTPVVDAAVAATCTSTGLTEGSHCSLCHEVLVAQSVTSAPSNHIPFSSEAIPATCKSEGLSAGSYCLLCHTVLVPREVIPMLPHEYEGGICTACGKPDEAYSVG